MINEKTHMIKLVFYGWIQNKAQQYSNSKPNWNNLPQQRQQCVVFDCNRPGPRVTIASYTHTASYRLLYASRWSGSIVHWDLFVSTWGDG